MELSNKHVAFNLFALFTVLYLITASGITIEQVDVSSLRLQVAHSIFERFDLTVRTGMGVIGYDGREYSWFGIGSVLFCLPFYLLGTICGVPEANVVSIMNQLIGASTSVLIYLFASLLGYTRRASIYTALIYGLGTMAFYYAKDPGDHVLETFFVLTSIYSILRFFIKKIKLWVLISGISLGFACITRPTSFIVLLPLLFMILMNYVRENRQHKNYNILFSQIIVFLTGFLPFVIIFLWYNHYRFGSITETGYSLIAARTGLDFFNGTALLTGLAGLLISSGKGFFYYSPISILFFFTVRSFFRKNRELATSFIILIVIYTLFYAKNVYWHGDWAWGPRYIFVLTPFLIIPVAELFDSHVWAKNAFVRRIICLLFFISITIQIVAVSVNTYKYFIDLQINKKTVFKIKDGEGVQAIVSMPAEMYFQISKSPILMHIKFISTMFRDINTYKYTQLSSSASEIEKIKMQPWMNVYDFWWVYEYYVNKSFVGFYVIPLFLLFIINSVFKLRRSILK